MGGLELAQIKQILQNASYEIAHVQNEVKQGNGSALKAKVEKLDKVFDDSKKALTELKELNVSLHPSESTDVNKLIEMILKIRSNKENVNPAVLQAILSSLQKIDVNLGLRLDEEDHKRGKKTAKVDYDQL